MKFTISDCISRINQALNYPAISYEDVSHFFDQAVAELNTSLRIAIPTVTEMRLENTFKISESENAVKITSSKATNNIPTAISDPEEGDVIYYIDGTSYLNNTFKIYKNGEWKAVPSVYGIAVDKGITSYEAVPIGYTDACWVEVPLENVREFSLTNYLPVDWIILFVIPYVCFKFAVRNGDNGNLFSDEYIQGFQQLQTSYNVPNTVKLYTVAHMSAYRKITSENIDNLYKDVPTRAIFDSMRIPNGIAKVYNTSSGGWDI